MLYMAYTYRPYPINRALYIGICIIEYKYVVTGVSEKTRRNVRVFNLGVRIV